MLNLLKKTLSRLAHLRWENRQLYVDLDKINQRVRHS